MIEGRNREDKNCLLKTSRSWSVLEILFGEFTYVKDEKRGGCLRRDGDKTEIQTGF